MKNKKARISNIKNIKQNKNVQQLRGAGLSSKSFQLLKLNLEKYYE